MQINTDSRYLSYQLTEAELLSGAILNSNQRALLQNKLAQAAEELLNIKVDTTNVLAFVQQQAFLQSKVDVLQQILDDSNEAIKILDANRDSQINDGEME